MVSERAGGRSGRSIFLAVLVTLAAPLAGYAAVRNAVLDRVGNAVDLTEKLPPRRLMPSLKALMREAQKTDARLPDDALRTARAAATQLPLAYEPFFIAAKVEERAGRFERAITLMEEARRRRPNAPSIRFALLGYYSLIDAYEKAINEAAMAMRVSAPSAAYILPGLAELAQVDPKARHTIAVALARKPIWRQPFFEAATAKMDARTAALLVDEIRSLRPSATADHEEAFLMRALVKDGDYREARAVWERFGAARDTTVFDGDFRGTTGMAPFAWSFYAGQSGNAEIAKGVAAGRAYLEVNYFGDETLGLAEQTLSLRPGRYRLSSTGSGESSATDIRLAWRLSCLPSDKPIATLPLQPLTANIVKREANATIPAGGCAGQKLVLLGEPGDISRTLNAQIRAVALVPLD